MDIYLFFNQIQAGLYTYSASCEGDNEGCIVLIASKLQNIGATKGWYLPAQGNIHYLWSMTSCVHDDSK